MGLSDMTQNTWGFVRKNDPKNWGFVKFTLKEKELILKEPTNTLVL
jgi:hypothetical protein